MAIITLKGQPVHTQGEVPVVGTKLKDFVLVNQALEERTLVDYVGKIKVFNIFPSIDTPVCATSARKFNEKVTQLGNVVVLNISKDLPFALGRFCAAEGLQNVETLSDFRGTLGSDYGVQIVDGVLNGLLSRVVIVADEDNKVLYVEQVGEITNEPDYESVIQLITKK